jgi:hypothetical protein
MSCGLDKGMKTEGAERVKTFLRCTVSPGQFSSEYAVSVRSFSGRTFSLFADRGDVECDQFPSEDRTVEGWVSVEIVNSSETHYLVQLPQSTLENGRFLSVNPSQLRGIVKGGPVASTP